MTCSFTSVMRKLFMGSDARNPQLYILSKKRAGQPERKPWFNGCASSLSDFILYI
jgi:hypothetical protein